MSIFSQMFGSTKKKARVKKSEQTRRKLFSGERLEDRRVLAAINYATLSSTVTENFDALATTGTTNAWTNETTLTGWSLFRQPAPGTAITTYSTGTGSSNAGNFYSFGASAATERALGGAASGGAYFGSPLAGAVAGWMAVAIQNNAGVTITDATIGYDGEQWRDGGSGTPVAQTMVMEYGFGSTFGAVSTWTAAGSSFNFTSPVFVNTGSGAAVDGNVAGLDAGIGGTISSLTWANGDTMWVRWIENNDAGNDHGLALDNFSFSADSAFVPSIDVNALTINEGQTVVLSTANLDSSDADTADTSLTFTASSVTGGQFELVSAAGTPITTFTQNDINTSAVQFVHNGGETAPTYSLVLSDGSNNSGAPQAASITFTNVNDPPVAADPTFFYYGGSPNGTVLGTVTVTDPDDSSFTFTIDSGNPGNNFAIDASGVITIADNTGLIGGGTFNLSITVDDGDNTDTSSVTLNETTNTPPAFPGAPFSFNVDENSAPATSVGTASTTDPDTPISYAITAGNGLGAFTINSASGEITVANSGPLDRETNPNFILTVTATDSHAQPLSGSATVNISLNNVVENPILNDDTFAIDENSVNTTAVGTLSPSFLDSGATVTYDITGGTGATAFAIDNSGNITVLDSAQLDFETTPTFTLDVLLTDSNTNTDTATITVNLNNVNEAPVVVTNRAITMNPGQTITIGNAILLATDIDTANASLIYTVTSGPANGTLTKAGAGITSFTNADLLAADALATAIRYTNTNGSADNIVLSLSDGLNVTPITLSITVVATTPTVNFTGADYTQNFDNLIPSPFPPDGSTLPTAMVTPAGWTGTEIDPVSPSGAPNNSTRIDNGVLTSGDSYMYGTTGSNERALGALGSGSVQARFGVALVNTTGVVITSLDLSYVGEQWRDGGTTGSFNKLAFSHSQTATSLTDDAAYTAFTGLDFTAVSDGSSASTGGLVGTANVSALLDLTSDTWGVGETLFLRWVDVDDTGNDDGLAIDDLVVSIASVEQTITGTAGADSFSIEPLSATTVSINGGGAVDASLFTNFVVDGGQGDDTYTVNFGTFTDIPFDITFNGGAGGETLGDKLVLSGSGSFTTITHQFDNANDGSVTANSTVINYTGLEPIADNLDAADRVFDFSNVVDAITLVDATGGQMTIDSNAAEATTFNDPTTSLTINAGDGNDTIDIDLTGSAYAGDLTIDGEVDSDTVTFSAALTADAVVVAAEFVEVAGNLSATSVDLGAATITATAAVTDITTTAFTLSSSATLEVDVDALTPDGKLTVAGDLDLNDATLSLVDNLATVNQGDVITVATYTSLLNGNTFVNAPNDGDVLMLGSDPLWITYGATAITLTAFIDATIGGTDSGDVEEDGTLQATGTLTITDPDPGEDQFASTSSLTGTYGTFTFVLSGANVGDWTYDLDNLDALVQALADGATVADTLTVTSEDGQDTHDIVVTITGLNDLPTLTSIEGAALVYDEGDGDVAITSTLVVGDVDTGATITGATVTIGTGYVEGEDFLNFADNFGVTGSFDGPSGVLTLSGTTSLSNYQAALRSVAFFNGSLDPTDGVRTIGFQVTDDELADSLVATRDVNVDPVNNVPTLTAFADVIDTTNEELEVELTFAELAAQGDEADVDGTVVAFVVQAVSSGTLKIGADALSATAFAAGTNDIIDGTLNAYWTPAGDASGAAIAAFSVVAQDDLGAESVTPVVASVEVVGVADAPNLSVTDPASGDEDTAIDLDITASLVDLSETLSIAIDGVPTGATLSAGTDNGGGNWTLTPAQLAGLTITPPLNSSTDFTITVTATSNDGGDTADTVDGIDVLVASVNDAPTITAPNGGAAHAFNVAENTPTSTILVTVVANDDFDNPAPNNLSYSLTGADAARFTIVGGDLKFVTNPNFEFPADAGANNVYNVNVVVTDDGTPNLTDTQALTITVTNVVEPLLAVDDTLTPNKTEDTPFTVASLVLMFNDSGENPLSILSVGNAVGGVVSINTGTGVITFTPTANYNGAGSFEYELTDSLTTDVGLVSFTDRKSVV